MRLSVKFARMTLLGISLQFCIECADLKTSLSTITMQFNSVSRQIQTLVGG
jgi:hypothetical protein